MTERRRFPLGLSLATLIALAILIALGGWQLQRRAWKEDILARIAALEKAAPAPLAPLLTRLAQGQDVEFVRVEAVCPGLASAPWVELYAVVEGQAGVRLISACPVHSGPYRSILVDRGFVADVISSRPAQRAADPTPVRVVGVLRAPSAPTFVTPEHEPGAKLWFSRDAKAMAAALGAPAPAPLFLMAESSTNPEWAALKPVAVPAQISNRHLEYALTWFGLAAALVGVYAAMLLRKRKN